MAEPAKINTYIADAVNHCERAEDWVKCISEYLSMLLNTGAISQEEAQEIQKRAGKVILSARLGPQRTLFRRTEESGPHDPTQPPPGPTG